MTEPNLDGILIDLAVANIDGSYGYDEEAHDKATKAIKALIANQVREARLDERSQAQQYLHGLTITPESQHLFDVLSRDNHNRIATLKGVKNK